MRAAVPTPLFGFNSTVRRRGIDFHIQTEDSGVVHPHVITHVFAEGGRIISTRRTSYAEHVTAQDRHDFVRRLLLEQHRQAIVELQSGKYDDEIAGVIDGHGEVRLQPGQVRPIEEAANSRTEAPRAAGPDVLGQDPTADSIDELIVRDVARQLGTI